MGQEAIFAPMIAPTVLVLLLWMRLGFRVGGEGLDAEHLASEERLAARPRLRVEQERIRRFR
jgi:hypothetical protein